MSQIIEKKAKKRKHSTAEIGQEVEPSTKRVKKDKSKKDKSGTRDKGKARATDEDGEFRVVRASMLVSIPPVFANNLRGGVQEMLDSLLMRYITALQGVVLAHSNLQFLESTAVIKADCPFTNCRVAFDATVWSPRIGMKLVAKVQLCSPDHVALLVHRTFNVSIPRHHIPTDQWEFEYGPAENDPEFRADVVMNGDETAASDVAAESGIDSGGRWVHKLTGARLGGQKGYLELTVVGLTIANQMLSLIGSIQHDPFSPEHVPSHAPTLTSDTQPRQVVALMPPDQLELELDGDQSDHEDTFEMLGRMGDAAREAEERAKQDEVAKKVKRKRKEVQSQEERPEAVSSEKKTKKKKS